MVSKADKFKKKDKNADKAKRANVAALLEQDEQSKASKPIVSVVPAVPVVREEEPVKANSDNLKTEDKLTGYTSMYVSETTADQINEIVKVLGISKVELYKALSGYEGE